MGVPLWSRMMVRREASRSRALARKAASPRRSVRAVECPLMSTFDQLTFSYTEEPAIA